MKNKLIVKDTIINLDLVERIVKNENSLIFCMISKENISCNFESPEYLEQTFADLCKANEKI